MDEAPRTEEAPDGAGTPLLSPDTLRRLRGLDNRTGGSLLQQLSDMFRVDTPPRLAAIRAAAEGGEPQTLLEAAHSLKGSCSMLGATVMAGLCHQLELLGIGETTDGSAILIDELDRCYQRTINALAEVAPAS